jgi:hypothetical protein
VSALKTVANGIIAVLSSLATSVTLLILLALLTWLGTLEQVEHGLFEVQKKYFESFFLVHDFGFFSLPLPGANLVMCVLFMNIIVGGIVRLRVRPGTMGVLVVHCGIVLMLVAGFVKAYFSQDGHVTLFEGQRSAYFDSYYRWEIVIVEPLGDGKANEYVAQQELFADATGALPAHITCAALPFELEVRHYMPNARPMPKGPMFDVDVPVVDGVFLKSQPLAKEAEQNIAGLYVSALGTREGARQDGIVWGAQAAGLTVNFEGRDFSIDLRHERYPMPFTIALEKFTKVDHPGIGMPKSFASDVKVVEDGNERALKISMNEPLRAEGLVVYQASWGPSTARPGDPLFSTFAVVRNPADQYPLYSCIVIAIGLVLHFSRKLIKHVKVEGQRS